MTSHFFYNLDIRKCALKYALTIGLSYDKKPTYTPIQENVSKQVANLFEALTHNPKNCLVQASYEQMIREIIDQYNFAVDYMGLSVEPWLSPGQPYANSQGMIKDVCLHKHLYYFKTESGYGDNDLDNPLLRPTEVQINGHQLLVNDMFRVIHDLFGHVKEGYSFGPCGEENAWLEHLHLFTPLARPVLTTETRGQTSWSYFGAHVRSETGALIKPGERGWTPPSERPYPKQKAGLLPSQVSGVQLWRDEHSGQIQVHLIENWNPAYI